MPLDVKALLRSIQIQEQERITAAKRKEAQQQLAFARAQETARSAEKRRLISNGLSSDSMDAMRFRWIGEHAECLAQIANSNLEELRTKIDTLIKQETIRRLSDLRKKP